MLYLKGSISFTSMIMAISESWQMKMAISERYLEDHPIY